MEKRARNEDEILVRLAGGELWKTAIHSTRIEIVARIEVVAGIHEGDRRRRNNQADGQKDRWCELHCERLESS
jgi:hypothetical protein